jgi:hypothetical protein
MVPLLNGIHLLYFGIGATALALNRKWPDNTSPGITLTLPKQTIRRQALQVCSIQRKQSAKRQRQHHEKTFCKIRLLPWFLTPRAQTTTHM